MNEKELPNLLERLGQDHTRISEVMHELAVASDALVREEGPDWQHLGELMHFLQYYADRVHHPLEDRVFDRLLHKGLTPTERHLVFNNLGQHQEIIGLTRKISEHVRNAVDSGVVAEEEFSEVLAEYISLQRKHMRFEESQLFPLLVSRLDDADWDGMQSLIDAVDSEQQPYVKQFEVGGE